MVESGEGLAQIFLDQLIEYTVLGLNIIVAIIIIILVGITLANLFKIAISSLRKNRGKEATTRICRSISKPYVKRPFNITRFLSRR